MRLIDADELVKFLKGCTMSNGTLINTNTMLSVIDKMPTAYDVDKVVAELEEHRANYDCRYCKYNKTEKQVCEQDCTDALIDDLFDIVKRGGVE